MRFIYQRFITSILLAAIVGAATANAAAADNAPHDYRDKNFDYFVTGDPRLPRAAHTEFTLALMGGGGSVDAAYAAIASHAGGGHIVILRAVSDDSFDPEDGDYGKSFATHWGPVESAETFVFHNRAAAFDPRVIASLRAADGIFLAGGDQGNYIRYWKGTPVQAALNAHVRANRPIGGSSAGLAILGHYSYTALDGGSMLEIKVWRWRGSVQLRGDARAGFSASSLARWRDHRHAHFSKRCRLGRLIVFVARINQAQPGGGVIGVGLDEKSALLIGSDGIGRLATGSAGSAWVVRLQRPAAILAKGQPLTMADIRIVRLDRDSSLDMRRHEVVRPAAQTIDSIERGAPSRESIASPIMLRSVAPPDEG